MPELDDRLTRCFASVFPALPPDQIHSGQRGIRPGLGFIGRCHANRRAGTGIRYPDRLDGNAGVNFLPRGPRLPAKANQIAARA